MSYVKRAGLIGALLLLGAACGGDKDKDKNKDKAPAKSVSRSCETNKECGKGFSCLANKCAAVSTKAILNNPREVVTPDKVKDELQRAADQHSKRIDQAMD